MKTKVSAVMASAMALGLALSGPAAHAAGVVTARAPMGLSGVYMSVFGGYALAATASGQATNGPTTYSVSLPLNSGYELGGAVGTTLMPNLRGEVELSFASRPTSGTLTFTGGGGTTTLTTSGTVAATYLMGNLWYDFDTGSSFTPYLGGGFGFVDVMPNFTTGGLGTATYNTSAFALGAQLGAGVKFTVADNVSLDLGYRIKDVVNASLAATPSSAPTISGVTYLDQAVQVGMQFGF